MNCSQQINKKLVLSIFLLYFIFWLYQGHFLFQLHQPILINAGIDNTYWLFCILRIPQTTIKYAVIFDFLLLITFVASFYTNNKWLYRLLFIIIIIHVITFNVYTGVHTKSCVIFPLIILPYCFPKHQQLLSDGVRYYLLFIFVSAAIHKLINGGLFNQNQFVHILENQHTDLSILMPTNSTYKISLWLIEHKTLANSLWYLFTFSELIFVVGFFTKKYDWLLLIILFGIIIGTFVLMRISLFDFILFIPLLVNINQNISNNNV